MNGQDAQMNGTTNKLIHNSMMFILVILCLLRVNTITISINIHWILIMTYLKYSRFKKTFLKILNEYFNVKHLSRMNDPKLDQNQNQLVQISPSRLEYLIQRSDQFSKLQAVLCQTQEMLLKSNTELESYKAEHKSSSCRKSARLSDMYCLFCIYKIGH